MCYRDNVPPLSFDGIHVACLCGDNGNGKSAIFDAMTWAIWGESRAKSDDDLIYLGQPEMEIELEFMSRGKVYRVLRKRSRRLSATRPGHTILELQISDNGSYKSMSGNSFQETQKIIIDLLNMDYQTFVNSAFLRQGHSDEFSIKRPGERKEIIATILNLSQYDELERKAKEKALQKKGEIAELDNSIEDIDTQLSRLNEHETKLGEIQQVLDNIEKEKKQKEQLLSALRVQKDMIERKKDQLKAIQDRIQGMAEDLNYWKQKLETSRKKIAEYESVMANKDDIVRGYTEYISTGKTNEEYNRKLGQLLTINEHINKLEHEIQKAGELLTIEYEKIRAKITDREQSFNKISSLEQSLTEARHDVVAIGEMEQELSTRRKEAQSISSRISYLESTFAQAEQETESLHERHKLLSQGETRCPLCETELGQDGIERIEMKLAKEIEDKEVIRQKVVQELSQKREILKSIEQDVAEKERRLNQERSRRQSRLDIIGKELEAARKAGNEIASEKSRLEEIEEQLANKEYAVHEQQSLTKLEQVRNILDYNKTQHETVKKQLEALIKYDSLKREYDDVMKYNDQEKRSLAEAELRISHLDAGTQEATQTRESLNSEIAVLSTEVIKLDQAEREYALLQEQERQQRDLLMTYQERKRHLVELDSVKHDKEALRKEAEKEDLIYRELTEAFSKKGVQALLISQAYPEIEMEANRLLGKMTDNRLSLKLESQREMRSKKNETIETLDIKIADELGTRNYEMYSGGEAFRIDLALRIALSKLLVRRAGASLPLLIIDEGFGTQDSSGRERLVEAINSIQDDFEKIFVITHLEELKESFPITINVVKTADGSTISIS